MNRREGIARVVETVVLGNHVDIVKDETIPVGQLAARILLHVADGATVPDGLEEADVHQQSPIERQLLARLDQIHAVGEIMPRPVDVHVGQERSQALETCPVGYDECHASVRNSARCAVRVRLGERSAAIGETNRQVRELCLDLFVRQCISQVDFILVVFVNRKEKKTIN